MLKWLLVCVFACTASAQELFSIEITGPTLVADGAATQFACTAHFDIGDLDVTTIADWDVEPAGLATIENGLLEVIDLDDEATLTISAHYAFLDQTADATLEVTAADATMVPGDYPTIQEAIDAAAPGALIVVSSGIYNEQLDIVDKSLTLSAQGGVTISGQGAGRVIRCLSSKQDQVQLHGFFISNGLITTPDEPGAGVRAVGVDLTMTGCFVQNCSVEHVGDNDQWDALGGGVSVENGMLTVDGCTFVNNACDSTWLYDHFLEQCSTAKGGGIYGLNADVLVVNSTFTNNQNPCPDKGRGGAIHVDGGSLTVSGCSFTSNDGGGGGGAIGASKALVAISTCLFDANDTRSGVTDPFGGPCSSFVEGHGGALHLDECDAMLTDVELVGNLAGRGGAIRSSGSLTMRGCVLRGNRAEGAHENFCVFCPDEYDEGFLPLGDGGAVVSVGEFAAIDCVFEGNEANAEGGALHVASGAVINCVLVGNVASGVSEWEPCGAFPTGYGGAIFGSVSCVNTVMSGNTANAAGGAAWGASTLTNCSLFGNFGGEQGTYAGGVELRNSIAWGNVGVMTGDASYSIIEGGFDGPGNIDADPLFADPSGPDGMTGTEDDDLRIGRGSPAIDAANNTVLPPDDHDLDGDGDVSEPLPVDADGSPRRRDDPFVADSGVGDAPIVDMGAYERQPACIADVNGDGVLNVLDFVAFELAWRAQEPIGDCTGDGAYDILDFVCFQQVWQLGCG